MKFNFLRTAGFAAVVIVQAGTVAAQDTQAKLAAAMAAARTETQNTRAALQQTISTLNKLAKEPGDLRPNYELYTAQIEKTRAAADATSKRYDTMSAESKTYFDAWKGDLASITSPDIRKVSEKRLINVQKDYDKVLKQLDGARMKFGPMMSDLDDLKTALGHDLSPNGLKALSKTIDKTNKSLAAAQAPVVNTLLSFDALSTALTPSR